MRGALRTQPNPLIVVVCGLTAALAAVCAALGGAAIGGLWIALVLACLGIIDNLARRSYLRHGRNGQIVTCEEIAAVAAPLVATPASIVLAVAVASLAGNLLARRPLQKAVWNVASYTLEATLAMVVFVELGGRRELSARSVLAALAAGAAFIAVNGTLFSLLLSKLGAGSVRRLFAQTIRHDFAHSIGVLTIGALGAIVLTWSSWTIVLIVLATTALEHGLGGYLRAQGDRDRLESLLTASSDGIFAVEASGRIDLWNPAMALLLAVDEARALGAPFREIAAAVLTPAQVDALLDGGPETVELGGVVDAMGTRRTLRVARAPAAGGGTIFTVSDSTALVSSLEVLRAHRDRLGLALQSSGSALWEWDADAGRFTWSENLAHVAPGTSFAGALGLLPEEAARVEAANRAVLDSGEPYEIEVRAAGAAGEPRWLRLRADAIRQHDRTLLRGISQDISEMRHREDEQRRLAAAQQQAASKAVDAEQRLQRMLSQMNDGFYAIDRDWRFVFVNGRGAELLGSTPTELVGAEVSQFADFSRGAIRDACRESMDSRTVARVEAEAVAPGRWFELTVHPVPEGIWVFSRETTDERLLEEQLRHAQKLEAVGQLAGGIAHDFNNLLTVINGYSSLALARATEVDAALARRVEQVLAAGQRAAALTTQLLAFSRQQVLRTRVIDLNATVLDVDGMLRRLLGPRVELVTRLDPTLGHVKADPGGLEQVLMNLCVNARDAIDGAGTITVQTGSRMFGPGDVLPDPDLTPGEYVVVSVSDTGCGIPEDVLPRIFEPFYTTKPPGSGTGLGLATAYGIVKQSGGALAVSTVPGQGTTFDVLLPRSVEQRVPDTESGQDVPGGAETILLVEDEEIVRRLTHDLLTSFGYTVLDAPSGEAALAVADHYDLLVSDVVMPGLSGVELARRLAAIRPGLRVLLVSGHSTDDIRALDGNRRWRYLPKPFAPQDLAWAVRELLDAPGDPGTERLIAGAIG